MSLKTSEYTVEDIKDMREFLTKRRDSCLGPDQFDAKGAVVYSHVIKVLYQLIEAQDE